ncbi:hypothetical protein [uncultured Jannaschia sp.]|uniref:hypothetical protein n=1 Tax=uncultured Jannaschia sp. TaxID=293347 RepID=UPI00260B5EEA|nr:hypothetical protein [uncultured Jannaschia sp.]
MADIAGLFAILVAAPYSTGFSFFAGYFSTFGIAFSEVDLSQGDFFLEAVNIARSPALSGAVPWGMFLLILILAYGFGGIVLRAANPPGSRLRRWGSAVVFFGLLVLICLVSLVGLREGRAKAETFLSGAEGMPVVTLYDLNYRGAKDAGIDTIDGMAQRLFEMPGTWRLIFADGQTVFLMGRSSSGGARQVLRISAVTGPAMLTRVRGFDQ